MQLQGFHRGGILPDTSPHVGPRMYHDHVGTHLADLCLDASLRALSDGKHRDYGGYADNDPQHCEEAAQLVVGECPDGYFY